MSRYGANKLLSWYLHKPNNHVRIITVRKQFYRHPYMLSERRLYWIIGDATLSIAYNRYTIIYETYDYVWGFNWLNHVFSYQHNGFEVDASRIMMNCTNSTYGGFMALVDVVSPAGIWYNQDKCLDWLIQQISDVHAWWNIKHICMYKQKDLRMNREVKLSTIKFT